MITAGTKGTSKARLKLNMYCIMIYNMTPIASEKTMLEVERILKRKEKKTNASVSLSREVIRATDAVAGKAGRSALVERAIRRYFRVILRRARNQHDLQAINAHADRTNRESDVLLDLQAWPQ
jgi:hypothetical protein